MATADPSSHPNAEPESASANGQQREDVDMSEAQGANDAAFAVNADVNAEEQASETSTAQSLPALDGTTDIPPQHPHPISAPAQPTMNGSYSPAPPTDAPPSQQAYNNGYNPTTPSLLSAQSTFSSRPQPIVPNTSTTSPRSGTPTGTPITSHASVPAAASTVAVPLPIPPVNESGSPTRVYLNQRVTPVLLEGIKQVARLEPERPLRWLSEYLAERSREVEGA